MSEGKANAQAGHAYVDALVNSLHHPDQSLRAIGLSYAGLRPGTKICLDGGSLFCLKALISRLEYSGIPHSVIIDQDHVELPDFDGSPVMTAIGLGPFHKSDTPKFIRNLPMWKGGVRTCVA